MNCERFQIIVIGSGFAGSLMAMVSRRLGFSTALVERGKHPRFVIGESTTPLANLLLEELAREYDLDGVRPLCKYGPWQQQLPQLACGLKRGFTFYHHQFDRPFTDFEGRSQLLVGASPREEVADTHWYRADFDQYLVHQAEKRGVTYLDQVDLSAANPMQGGMRLRGTRNGKLLELKAELVIDASGPRGFLYRQLRLGQKTFASLPPTQALFSHFIGVGKLPESFGLADRVPPYPPENAAVHHIFPGGWIWVLKFNNGITSAGVAATDEMANGLGLGSGEPGWMRLLERLPSLREVFAGAKNVVPFVYQPRLAFCTGEMAGPGWVLLPSAAGVIDPLLSTGFPLTLLGVKRLGRILSSEWRSSSFLKALDDYSALTSLELETTSTLVGALYSAMDRFDLFKALSLLYFAAASFSEVSRRLGKSHLADSFLLCRDAQFGPELHKLCRLATRARSAAALKELKARILNVITPFDLAGLTDQTRDPWYPARGDDILRNAGRLGATKEELQCLLG